MARFLTLDAMRGVAALVVTTSHLGPLIGGDALPQYYLAVDLFFILSGFVLDHAYAQRLAHGWPIGTFVLMRYIRLYPLYILGTLVGIAASGLALAFGQGVLSPAQWVIASITSVFMLPSPTWAGDSSLSPMNGPAWSLMFEIFINIIYALTFRWLTPRTIAVIIGLSALGLCGVEFTTGTIAAGWKYPDFWMGFPRVFFGFFVGVALHRLDLPRLGASHGAYVLPLLLLALFSGWGGGTAELLKLFLAFPLVVALGSIVEPPRVRLAHWLGLLSYPLYATSTPVMQVLERALTVLHVDRAAIAPWGGLTFLILMVVASLLADAWYDQPVRAFVTAKLKRRESKTDRPAYDLPAPESVIHM